MGLVAFPRIPADILPDFNRPVVVSFFSYPGLPTTEMENSVTSRVERALTLAGGLDRIESRSEPANLPVVLAAITGEGLSESELYSIGYYAVRNKMGGLQGVQIPHPFGGRFRQMMIYVDPQKLEAYQLSAVDVVDALENANLVLAGGTLKLGTTDYQVHTVNTLPTTIDIDNVPVAIRDGRPIFVKDIGYARDDAAIQYNIVRVNGNRSVYAPLLREPGENTIDVVDRIREGLAQEIPNMKLRGEIPEATQVDLVSDQSEYIRRAISNLQYEVLLGAGLVALVILMFLRNFRASLAVFTPVIFLTGMIQDLFAPLSQAAVITIAASYVVAMTVVPAFCARFLAAKRGTVAAVTDKETNTGTAMEHWYERQLNKALRWPRLTTTLIVAATAGSFLLLPYLGSELFPDVDAGHVEIRIKTIPGTRLEETEKLVAEIENTINEIIPADELQSLIANIGLPVGKGAGFSTVLSSNSGPDTAFLIVNLVNEGRSTSTRDYVERLRETLSERFPREKFLFVTGGIINAALNEGVAAPIDIQISAGSLARAREAAEQIVRAVRQVPGAADVQIAQALDYPQLDIEVDRTKAAYYGLSQRDVAENVLTALGSSTGLRPMIWVDPQSGTEYSVAYGRIDVDWRSRQSEYPHRGIRQCAFARGTHAAGSGDDRSTNPVTSHSDDGTSACGLNVALYLPACPG